VSSRSSNKFRLLPGDRVGVVAPGFAVKPSLLKSGIEVLEKMGFQPVPGRHLLARQGYLAGNDDLRLADLQGMLSDPEVSAIWFARGGYGCSRILDRISWRMVKRRPKLLIGYSDLTALFSAAIDRAGCTCLYGPVVTELGDRSSYHAASLRDALAGKPREVGFGRGKVLAAGKAKGRLVGGNLSMLAHLCGTRFFPELRGSILFLEETGEETYRIDRMLQQLRLAGALRRVEGLVLGAISVPARRRFPPDRPLREVLKERLGALGVPVVAGLRAGHIRGKIPLPLGRRAELDTGAGRLRFPL